MNRRVRALGQWPAVARRLVTRLGAPDHSDRLASRMLPAGAVPGLGGTGLARSCEQARAARGERPVNAPGESGRVISQASAHVWDAYDAAVREAQAGVMESAGRWPLTRISTSGLQPQPGRDSICLLAGRSMSGPAETAACEVMRPSSPWL